MYDLDEFKKRAVDAKVLIQTDIESSAFFSNVMGLLTYDFVDDGSKTAPGWVCGTNVTLNLAPFRNANDYPTVNDIRTLIEHEVRHVALLHMARKNGREHKKWNMACDFEINNNLVQEGEVSRTNASNSSAASRANRVKNKHVFSNHVLQGGCLGLFPANMDAESIYKILEKMEEEEPEKFDEISDPDDLIQPDDSGDPSLGGAGGEMTPEEVNHLAQTIETAMAACDMSNQAGSVPGSVREWVKNFREPKIDWHREIMHLLTKPAKKRRTWSRMGRRSTDIVIRPYMRKNKGRLEHIAMFQDCSGSVSSQDIEQFNGEANSILSQLKPEKITMVMFDYSIQEEIVTKSSVAFKGIDAVGRGGTSFECVRQWIEKNKPKCAIIFSDMDAEPMEPLSKDVHTEVIWVGVNSVSHTPKVGRLIKVRL